jgi:hypothetical protein
MSAGDFERPKKTARSVPTVDNPEGSLLGCEKGAYCSLAPTLAWGHTKRSIRGTRRIVHRGLDSRSDDDCAEDRRIIPAALLSISVYKCGMTLEYSHLSTRNDLRLGYHKRLCLRIKSRRGGGDRSYIIMQHHHIGVYFGLQIPRV